MIRGRNIYKRYINERGRGPWVLHDASFHIPAGVNVGLIGANGVGKSTLMRLMSGIDIPTHGVIESDCRISWPLGMNGGLHGPLSGRQNAKFVCRIHGLDDELHERLEWIKEFTELGDNFEKPVKHYAAGMRARLRLGISLAFDFDVYLADELFAVGDRRFNRKAREIFREKVDEATLIVVAHQERLLKEFCTAGLWLHDGKAYWFDEIDEAYKYYSRADTDS